MLPAMTAGLLRLWVLVARNRVGMSQEAPTNTATTDAPSFLSNTAWSQTSGCAVHMIAVDDGYPLGLFPGQQHFVQSSET